jgi:tellurite resistance protein TerC
MTVPIWAWIATIAVFALLIGADLILTRGRDPGLRATALLSALWVAAGLAFGGALWLWQGAAVAGQYFGGYLLEKALSVDNVFVFVLLFGALVVPLPLQRRVLHFGVLGALVLRAGFIAAGGALVGHIGWVFYVFGALVLLAGARMLRPGAPTDPGKNVTVRALRRLLPVTSDYDGGRFFTRARGKVMATPLFVALVAIETTDLVFALDSIPAVFGITRNLFVVFTSNAFAVLGLRALYFLLAGSVNRFAYLKQGLAVLLMFIGVKMLISPFVHIPVTVSLTVIVIIVGCAVAASLWRDRSGRRPADEQRPAGPHRRPAREQHRPVPR